MIKAKVVGCESLAAKFKRLEMVAQTKMLESALVGGALVVQNEWKARTPYKTGTYRRSIHIGGHTELAGDFEGQDMGSQAAGPGQAAVVIGTNITDPPYPKFLEEGTSKMAARPSAGPALDAKRSEAVREVGEALKDMVRKLK